MLQDIVRAIVTLIMRDKIVLALVVIGLLGLFVGGFNGPTEQASADRSAVRNVPAPQAPPVAQQNQPQVARSQPAPAPQPTAPPPLDADTAVDFVKWWSYKSMDYSSQTCAASHDEAFKWMTDEAKECFKANFWPPDMEVQIKSGAETGAFQPATVQAECMNPDGSIVVGLTGMLVLQTNGSAPISQQVNADFLIKKDQIGQSQGLRVIGLYNKALATVPPPAMETAEGAIATSPTKNYVNPQIGQ